MEPTTFNRKVGKLMGDLFAATVDRGNRIKAMGYHLVEMWECEWAGEKKNDRALREKVASYDLGEPLKARDALFGGRTNGLKLFQETSPGTNVIRYFDIKSLYPFVNARRAYPVAHPSILLEGFEPLATAHLRYRGLIKCVILPPRHLYIPVLPIRTTQKKLLFALCRICAEEMNQNACQHVDEERALRGTWPHVEVAKAVEKGYRILAISEVWHWAEWTEALFSDYINTFYAVKEAASGYPEWVHTEDDKRQHIQNVERRDGVILDPTKIEKNPGLRQVAKLALNR